MAKIVDKATVAKTLLRQMSGMSDGHALWANQKDLAKAKGLDVGTFKSNLGKALDELRDMVQNVDELLKLHALDVAHADKEWKDAIKKRFDAVVRVRDEYVTECDRKAEKHADDDAKAKGWRDLKGWLKMVLPNKVNDA